MAADRPEYHEVQKGETLLSIAFQYGVDFRELGQWNVLDDPNVLRLGQRLRLSAPEGGQAATPLESANGVVVDPLGGVVTPLPGLEYIAPAIAVAPSSNSLKTEPGAVKPPGSVKADLPHSANVPGFETPALRGAVRPPASEKATLPGSHEGENAGSALGRAATPSPASPIAPGEDAIHWIWPARGKAKALFNESSKGIDISGARGQAVNAAAAGKVIHVGSNLRGYGKLVIIQHSSMFLSTYAHNNQVLVKQGERVGKGQKIAEMGDTDTDQVKLHFEIRRFGKPVDPLKYLPVEKAS